MCMIFFFNDTATTEIYTLSLHDALPICGRPPRHVTPIAKSVPRAATCDCNETSLACTCNARFSGQAYHRAALRARPCRRQRRSEEHTSELQSRQYLVCRLLLEKKKHTA